MHFIAMLGFRVSETSIRYDTPLSLLSLAVTVVVVAIGVFVVGYRGTAPGVLLTAGTLTGLGVAAMHHLAGGSTTVGVLPMLVGPLIFLVLSAVVVMFDPLLIMGDDEPVGPRPRSRVPHGY